jgi:hypothetical protein
MHRFVAAAAILSVAALLGPSPASAGRKGKKQTGTEVVVGFTPDTRDAVRVYWVETHGRGKCPPGLAKKNNGCLPPGQAKKRYTVGHALPSNVVIEVVPVELSVRIGPPPHGYRYGMVDGDIVKLAVGTALVVDAIQGLVD